MDRLFKGVSDRFRGLRQRDDAAPESEVGSKGTEATTSQVAVSTMSERESHAAPPATEETDAETPEGTEVVEEGSLRAEILNESGSTEEQEPDPEAAADTASGSEGDDVPAVTADGDREFSDAGDDGSPFVFVSADDTTDGDDEFTFSSGNNDDEFDDQESDELTLSSDDDAGTLTSGEFTFSSDDGSDEAGLTDGSGGTITIGDGSDRGTIVAGTEDNDDSSDETEEDEPVSSAIDYPQPEPEEEPESSFADYPEDQSESDPVTSAEDETIDERPSSHIIGVVSGVVTSDDGGSSDPRLEPMVSHERIAGLDVLEGAQISLADDDEALTADDLIEKPSRPDDQPAPGTIPTAPDQAGSPAGGQPSADASHLDLETESETGDGSTSPSSLDYQLAEDPRFANIEYHGDLIVTEEDDDELVPVDDGIDRPEVENERAPGEGPPSPPGPKSADLDVINTDVMAGDSEAGEPSKSADLVSSGDGDVSDPSKTVESQTSPSLEFVQSPEVAKADATIDFATAPELKQQPEPADTVTSIPAPAGEPALVTEIADVPAVPEVQPVIEMDAASDDEDDSDDGM